MHYKQLTREERYQISALLKIGHNQTEIATMLGKDKSSISREIIRNRGKYSYHPNRAHKKAMSRRQPGRHKIPEVVWMLVEEKIRQELSPEQVSGWMKKNKIYLVSHEAIYQHIYRDKQQGGDLYRHLRRHKTRRKRTGSYELRGRLKNRISIEQRPEEVEKRERIGDWEVDTIIGRKQQQAIVTMVERRTRFTILAKVVRRTSEAVSAAMSRIYRELWAIRSRRCLTSRLRKHPCAWPSCFPVWWKHNFGLSTPVKGKARYQGVKVSS